MAKCYSTYPQFPLLAVWNKKKYMRNCVTNICFFFPSPLHTTYRTYDCMVRSIWCVKYAALYAVVPVYCSLIRHFIHMKFIYTWYWNIFIAKVLTTGVSLFLLVAHVLLFFVCRCFFRYWSKPPALFINHRTVLRQMERWA